MSKTEKESRINSFALTFLERQQIVPNLYADQIIRAYKEGYNQAEKDLELGWEDIRVIEKLLGFDNIIESPKEFYQEVLKRFKDYEERKEE